MRRTVPKDKRRPARLQLGNPIREARRASGLTQEALGRRLGLKGRAVYRWERNEAAPSARHCRALIRELHLFNPQVAIRLQASIIELTEKKPVAVSLGSEIRPATPLQGVSAFVSEAALGANGVGGTLSASSSIEFALLKLADELDVTPRRARRALFRLCERLSPAVLQLQALHVELERLVAQD